MPHWYPYLSWLKENATKGQRLKLADALERDKCLNGQRFTHQWEKQVEYVAGHLEVAHAASPEIVSLFRQTVKAYETALKKEEKIREKERHALYRF